MKKSVLFTGLLLLSAFAVFAQSGIIREMTGEVELKPAGAAAFVPASAGAEVAPNTIVSTGFRSTAVIAVGSSLITVRPLTRLSLAEIQTAANSENISVSLQTGRVRVEVKPPAGTKTSFSVQSPSATASVRGTSFEFDTFNLKVNEGAVAFKGSTGVITVVNAGNETYVQKDGRPASPSEVAASSLLPAAPVGAVEPETAAAPARTHGDMTVDLFYGEE